jgi:SAM-dependent methyltransferase
MDGVDSQAYWNQHAAIDPLWAVLSFPDKRGKWNLQEFMKTGEREIALLFHRFDELQLTPPTTRALDFGCGVGRLTQALARRVERVTGADISSVMIDHARRLNQYPGADYLCTSGRGLDTLPSASFDCIYSNIVLQHVVPDLSISYLNEFFRLLRPNGLLVFQLPSHRESMVSAEIKAMPDSAYRASIALAAAPPEFVTAGSTFNITLNVGNASSEEWSQPRFGPLAVGNHWLDAAGELMVTQDDGRAPLLQVVPPGLEWPVLISLRAPATPGRYVVELDLVHEGVTWWTHKGSPTVRFTIEVQQDGGATSTPAGVVMREFHVPNYPDDVLPAPPASLPPSSGDFPIYGVPREEVMKILHHHNARLAYLEEDRRAGPVWVSYRYFIVR